MKLPKVERSARGVPEAAASSEGAIASPSGAGSTTLTQGGVQARDANRFLDPARPAQQELQTPLQPFVAAGAGPGVLGGEVVSSLLPQLPLGSVQFRALSPDAQFLRVMAVTLPDHQRLNAALPLNPVSESTPVFFRRRGVDAQNGMVLSGAGKDAAFVLREQARASVLSRAERGLPGGYDFVLAESSGGSQFVEPQAEKVLENARHELAEELRVDPHTVTMTIRAEGVAVSPDVSAATFSAVASHTTSAITLSNDELQNAASGEIAETGARAQFATPSEAVSAILDGRIIDGRAAYVILKQVLDEGLPIDATVRACEPLPLGSTHRRAAVDDGYNQVTLTARPDVGYQATGVEIRGYDFTIAALNHRLPTKTDVFAHMVAIRPDQVNELPVVRDAAGTLWVGLVPTVSPGLLARQSEQLVPLLGGGATVAPTPIQLRGLVRDVAGYTPTDGASSRGNLRVAPEYEGAIAEARQKLSQLGLHDSGRSWNAGQFTASAGENGFNMNLVVREYEGAVPKDSTAIRFVPLTFALEQARDRPNEMDQMTQLQLMLLALREGKGFNLR